MSIENINVIDTIGVDNETNDVFLTISDHLDWIDSENHLLILQEKINSYLSFIESGEIYESYPEAKGKGLVICVYSLHSFPEDGMVFILEVNNIIKSLGISLVVKQHPEIILYDSRKE